MSGFSVHVQNMFVATGNVAPNISFAHSMIGIICFDYGCCGTLRKVLKKRAIIAS